MSRKLNIGGDEKSPGWEVFNAVPGPSVDHLGDSRDLSRFPDNTFTDVYASHVVEHLDYINDLVNTLREWHRVLIPGGTFYVSVPDLDVLSRLIQDKVNLTLVERLTVMRMIFGGHLDKYDYHQVGLNQEFLEYFLPQAGFTDLRRVNSFGLFRDSSVMHFKGVPISVNIIAKKPLDE